MKSITPQPAETIAQAIHWENVKNGYTALGLCDGCAAQAAWGHQEHAGGWNDLHPPCTACASIVAAFPIKTTNPAWQKTTRQAQREAKDAERHSAMLADAGEGSNRYQSIGCGRCQSRWTGLNSAHCAACHHTFTSISAFDKHRAGSHAVSTRHCVDPETAGLVPANRGWPGWSLPGTWDGPAE